MQTNRKPISLVWLRRDLRLYDHAALAHALKGDAPIQPVFIFDTDILKRFTNKDDRRLSFIAHTLTDLDQQLQKRGGGLLVLHGSAQKTIPKLAQALNAKVFAAEDYEPEARKRDESVGSVATFVKDQVIFAPKEVAKENGDPYKVFTPYSRAWRAQLTPISAAPYEIHDKGRYADVSAIAAVAKEAGLKVLDMSQGAKALLADIGYLEVYLPLWPVQNASERLVAFSQNNKIQRYKEQRDLPGQEGTSRLSPYLRFGLVSVRECLRVAQEQPGSDMWVNELIWREFYAMILYHYPESCALEWNPVYRETLDWSHNADYLQAWKNGKTGYPIVDAAMRQLRDTGWMHNRARMIVASFLTKHLRIDWRLGEEHFAQLLMDYDMASNVGGWQWAASTGTDAQPWFRIFNPTLQSKKFDPKGDYIRRYVPELKGLNSEAIHEPWKYQKPLDYPLPIVDHAVARQEALAMFKRAAS